MKSVLLRGCFKHISLAHLPVRTRGLLHSFPRLFSNEAIRLLSGRLPWWVLYHLPHIMYLIWWNPFSACSFALDSVWFAWMMYAAAIQGLNSHLGKQSFFRGQPRASETWPVTARVAVRFIWQTRTWLVMFSGSRLRLGLGIPPALRLHPGAKGLFLLSKSSARPVSPGELRLEALTQWHAMTLE